MSKGWYVKVDIPVHFNIDCNVGVVGSCEREAEQQAREIVTKNLMADFPWDFEAGGFHFTRGCETFGWDERDISCIVTADSDFDPDPDPVTDVHTLMETAQCLNECFHDLPKDHELVKWREDNGIAATRDQINLCAVLCEQAHKIMLRYYEYDDCYDWDFCPKFLEYCVDYEKFEPKSDNPQHLVNMFRVGVQNA